MLSPQPSPLSIGDDISASRVRLEQRQRQRVHIHGAFNVNSPNPTHFQHRPRRRAEQLGDGEHEQLGGTHLHLFSSDGEHEHYLVTGAFSINNGVVVGHNGATVTRIEDLRDEPQSRESESESRADAAQEIINYLPLHTVTRAESEKSEQCRVCMEKYEQGCLVMTLPCFHAFHAECITQWLSQDSDCCVICRHPISHYDIESEQEQEQNVD